MSEALEDVNSSSFTDGFRIDGPETGSPNIEGCLGKSSTLHYNARRQPSKFKASLLPRRTTIPNIYPLLPQFILLCSIFCLIFYLGVSPQLLRVYSYAFPFLHFLRLHALWTGRWIRDFLEHAGRCSNELKIHRIALHSSSRQGLGENLDPGCQTLLEYPQRTWRVSKDKFCVPSNRKGLTRQ